MNTQSLTVKESDYHNKFCDKISNLGTSFINNHRFGIGKSQDLNPGWIKAYEILQRNGCRLSDKHYQKLLEYLKSNV